MATRTFYLLGSGSPAVAPGWFGQMQDGGTAPTAAQAGFGWKISKAPTGYYKAFLGASSESTAAAQGTSWISGATGPTKGTGASATTAGDCYMTPAAYSGTFAAGAWTLSLMVRAGTAGMVGHLNMRVWASVNADGSSARELTSGSLVGTAVTLSTTADVNGMGTTTWSPGAITLNNEYLFFQLEWQETTTGSTNNDDCAFRIGTGLITTTSLAVQQQISATFAGAGSLSAPANQWFYDSSELFVGSGLLAVAELWATIDTAELFAVVGLLAVAEKWQTIDTAETVAGAGTLACDATVRSGTITTWQGSGLFAGAGALVVDETYYSAAGIVFSQSLIGMSGNWQGRTLRQRFEEETLNMIPAGNTLAVRFEFAVGTNGSMDAAWIGEAGGAQPYDFDGNQVQLTFSGATSVSVVGAQTVTSDQATSFSFDPTKALVVSASFSGSQVNLMGYGG
jgi:hypothetical protein